MMMMEEKKEGGEEEKKPVLDVGNTCLLLVLFCPQKEEKKGD